MTCKLLTKCVACGSEDLVPTLDLNDQPLANNFQHHPGASDAYPLAVNRCNNCNHLQLTHIVDPEVIYKNYLYVSGTSQTYLDYMDWYAKFVLEIIDTYIDKNSGIYNVLDIGCNDGSQLDAFKNILVPGLKKISFNTYGVDPAENLHAGTVAKGHRVELGFWNQAIADKFDCEFDVITSQNAFAHIPDPVEYLKLAKEKLKRSGLVFISTSQADMVKNREFDTIYHEHISYYNVASMKALAERAGLFLIDVIKTPIHGTSYIFVLSQRGLRSMSVVNFLAMESAVGLDRDETYTDWANDVRKLLDDLRKSVDTLRQLGYTIVGYGAAAKGMTLLNASKIHLDCVIDDNPLKQGRYCPGTDIPVVGIDWLDRVDPGQCIAFIPLAWNFYKEIKARILSRRDHTEDVFLRYFPGIKTEFNPENKLLK